MTYNLTPKQKEMLKELVALIQAEEVEEEFHIKWFGNVATGYKAMLYNRKPAKQFPTGTRTGIDALVENNLLSRHGNSDNPLYGITNKAYQAIESNFAEPDICPDTVINKINNFSNAQFAGGFAEIVQGNQIGGSINNQASEIPSLAEVASEIRNLLETIKILAPNAIDSVQRLTELNLGLIEYIEKIEAAREKDAS